MKNISDYLKKKKNIFDIGTGPNGSHWWKEIDNDAKITGIDWFFFPKKIPSNIKIYKYDASLLDQITDQSHLDRVRNVIGKTIFINEKVQLNNKFDLVVANHVIEHVENPENLIKGAASLLKTGGIMYAGFPESSNFTDIFYHLVHPEGGGHIYKVYKNNIIKLFEKHGFELLSCEPWPDDWLWFEKLYDWKNRGIKYITQEDINYLCNVFRKELTIKRGYIYGWEMVFKLLT